jgi:hypothetical protein
MFFFWFRIVSRNILWYESAMPWVYLSTIPALRIALALLPQVV